MKSRRYELLQDIIQDLLEIARPVSSENPSITGHFTKEFSVNFLYIMFLDKRPSAKDVILINGHLYSITIPGTNGMDVLLKWLKSVELKTFKASLYSSEKHFLFDNCGIMLYGFLLFCCQLGQIYCSTRECGRCHQIVTSITV